MVQFDNAVERYGKIILNEMKEVGVNCWIAGGALRDYFMGIPIKTDYDMFFPNEDEYNKAMKYFKEKECEIKWESENGCKLKYKGNIYDLVKKFFPNPQETIDAFDFTVSMLAVDTEKIYHGETTFIDMAKSQIMINKITYPASSLSRAFRYHRKGFSMCKGEMKKLYDAIQNAPKTQPEVNPDVNKPTNENELSSGELNELFAGID